MSFVIETEAVWKTYPLYAHPSDRVKEALHPLRRKYHKEFNALRDVNIRIRKGECVALVGLNGSGKSTLLQIIAKVLNPSSGRVEVQGRVAALLELGSGFNAEMSGRDNARFQCSLLGVPHEKIDELIEKIEDFAEIGAFIDQPVKTYSSGMTVRLAFAAAVAVDPDILIVDEALAVGDAYFQTKSLERIKAFQKAGKTLIFVSHDPGIVRSICSRAYLLQAGQIIQEGTPDHVFQKFNELIAARSARPHSQEREQHVPVQESTQHLHLLGIALRDHQGMQVDTLVSGEERTIEIEFSAEQSCVDPTVHITLFDRMGHEIFGISNLDLRQPFGPIRAGQKYRARFRIKLNLGMNTYTVLARIASGDVTATLNDPLIFRVLPSPQNKFVGSCSLETKVTCHPSHSAVLPSPSQNLARPEESHHP